MLQDTKNEFRYSSRATLVVLMFVTDGFLHRCDSAWPVSVVVGAGDAGVDASALVARRLLTFSAAARRAFLVRKKKTAPICTSPQKKEKSRVETVKEKFRRK